MMRLEKIIDLNCNSLEQFHVGPSSNVLPLPDLEIELPLDSIYEELELPDAVSLVTPSFQPE